MRPSPTPDSLPRCDARPPPGELLAGVHLFHLSCVPQGEWTAETAGGSSGYPTFSDNPSFVLSSPAPGTAISGWSTMGPSVDVFVVLSQPVPPTNTIGFYLATRRDKRFVSKEVTFVHGTEGVCSCSSR